MKRITHLSIPTAALLLALLPLPRAHAQSLPLPDWETSGDLRQSIVTTQEILGTVHSETLSDPVLLHIYNFDFSLNPAGEPQVDPTILVGETVRWVWDEGVHSTTAALDQLEFWDSPIQSTGIFEHTFTQPGVYHYYSKPFGFDNLDGTAGGMAGTITVLIPETATTGLALVLGCVALMAIRRRSGHRPQP